MTSIETKRVDKIIEVESIITIPLLFEAFLKIFLNIPNNAYSLQLHYKTKQNNACLKTYRL
jgi:hypothetical protein